MQRVQGVGWVLLSLAGLGCEEAAVSSATTPEVADSAGPAADVPLAELDTQAVAPDVEEADPGPPPPPPLVAADVLAAGPHGVSWKTVTLVDVSRSTPPNGDYAGAADRTLVTDVYFPSSEGTVTAPEEGGALKAGPWPLVVYAHGYMSGRNENVALYAYLASHGFVVAVPTFPLAGSASPGGPTLVDIVNQPGDVSFVADRVIAESLTGGVLAGAVADPPPLAVVGLSLGGLTTGLVSLYPDFRDKRIQAFVVMAGPLCLFPKDAFPADSPPGLLMYGSADRIAPYEANGRKTFENMQGSRRLLTIQDGTHVGFAALAGQFFDGLEDPDSVGCNVLTKNLAGKKLGELASRVGFGDGTTDAEVCPEPCTNLDPVTTMGTNAQSEIVTLAIGAFLRHQFGGEAALQTFLDTGLPAERGSVTVEIRVP